MAARSRTVSLCNEESTAGTSQVRQVHVFFLFCALFVVYNYVQYVLANQGRRDFTLWAFRRTLFEKIWHSSFRDSIRQNLLHENPHKKVWEWSCTEKYIVKMAPRTI